MTMSNPSKQKGTRAESKVVKYLNDLGFDAERLALHGAKDEGDIRVRCNCGKSEFRLEVKTGKQTANPSRKDLETWLQQSAVEEENAGCPCFLVVARYGKSPKDFDVYYKDDPHWTSHTYLDVFVEDNWRTNGCECSRDN